MTPQMLAEYLKVMRDAGLIQAAMEIPWQFAETDVPVPLKMSVVFGPDPGQPLPGEAPTPGGWKGPATLDAPFTEHEASLP